ncbi:DUF364 domain-containing protein [Clostridium sp. E02]|uniref:Rossmann-like domain-containing protein n=1 Tax=Clostridium sp. E02 TaxID=2487134 RepID=UPI000F54BA0D|nr:DUF364 domain-containing protein [Clostridium sp. E02]
MTQEELMDRLKREFQSLVEEHHLDMEEVTIRSKSLTPEEAIGNTKRRDFPILTGKEVMLQAEYQGARGQAFTDAPSKFEGTLHEIQMLDVVNNLHDRGLFIATMNAVMTKLGMIDHTVHCRTEEPENCALELYDYVKNNYGTKKIALVGYQPSILEALSKDFTVRVLDLNPQNVGQLRYGVKVLHGINDYKEVVLDWADVVLCTGSTLSNGTIVNFLDIGKEVLFFGITIAGAAKLLGLKRFCPCSQ